MRLLTGLDGSVRDVSVLFVTHEAYLEHSNGRRHPERPERLGAVIDGITQAGVGEALIPLVPEPAPHDALARVHDLAYLDRLVATDRAGGGRLDPDTTMSNGSWRAAQLAAGAGLTAIDALLAGEQGASAAFCAVRPPGHHATPAEAMGFCILSNVAVVAAELAARGERVVIVDIDAHHGNGTQDCFYRDGRVLYVSLHQWPLYPGTGRYDEVGEGAGLGTTLNVPLPPGATGDVYLASIDELVGPVVAKFAPTWLIISAGFDAHAADPITDLGLSAGDYALITRRLLEFAPPGRRLVVLEGGYDLDALRNSSAATFAALLDRQLLPEPPTDGGPGRSSLEHVRNHWYANGSVVTPRRACDHGRSLDARDPRALRPGAGRTGPARRAVRRGRSPALPRRRDGPRSAARSFAGRRTSTSTTTDAPPKQIKTLSRRLGRLGLDPGRAVRDDRRPPRRADLRDHHPPGGVVPARLAQAGGDLRRRRSTPICRAATSRSTRWRSS